MLIRAAIAGGLLLTTGIAAGQVLSGQPGSLKLSDFVVRAGAAATGAPTCPWDCEANPDKGVGINDFLAGLATWAVVDAPCDFDGGGVGINDFLAILAHWGPFPAPINDECAGQITI